jgi:two-component system, sensor histidine kinase
MDIMMPEMDGMETTKAIRENNTIHNKVPIVALSANVTNQIKEDCKKVGMNDFLQKPFKKSEILAMIQETI